MVATQNHLGYSDAADVVALLAGTRDATETG
jgi:hypothetical protein